MPSSGRGCDDAFGPGAQVQILLHPPVLRALGLKRKLRLGSSARPLLASLRAGRRLRGTALDPFGRTAIRRLERDADRRAPRCSCARRLRWLTSRHPGRRRGAGGAGRPDPRLRGDQARQRRALPGGGRRGDARARRLPGRGVADALTGRRLIGCAVAIVGWSLLVGGEAGAAPKTAAGTIIEVPVGLRVPQLSVRPDHRARRRRVVHRPQLHGPGPLRDRRV